MLNKFRTRYPKGNLISELIKIDAGKYLVKASIVVEGITLATGLAAAASIEVAEDQARNRALALLALDVRPADTTNPVSVETKNTPVFSTSLPTSTPLPTPNNEQVWPKSQSSPLNQSNIEVAQPKSNERSTKPTDSDLTPEPVEIFSLPTAHSLPSKTPNSQNQKTKNQSSARTTNPAEKTLNVDQVINLVTVEMKRLGWTTDQGRNYLIQTYGKRSRHLLTDEELLEFFEYLKTQ